MPFCNKCGTEVAEGINFCGKCGNALNSAQSPNQTNYAASGISGGTPFVMGSKMLFRIIGKLGYIFVVIGFCMPIACDMNGFRLSGYMFDHSKAIFGLLTIIVFVSAIIGIIIGMLLLTNKTINTRIDWITTVACIASGFIVYLGCLKDDVELQSGAYVILVGWIIALIGQIMSMAGSKVCSFCGKKIGKDSSTCPYCKEDLSLSPPDDDLGDDIDAQVLCEEMNRKRKRNAVLVLIGTVVVGFILIIIAANS